MTTSSVLCLRALKVFAHLIFPSVTLTLLCLLDLIQLKLLGVFYQLPSSKPSKHFNGMYISPINNNRNYYNLFLLMLIFIENKAYTLLREFPCHKISSHNDIMLSKDQKENHLYL